MTIDTLLSPRNECLFGFNFSLFFFAVFCDWNPHDGYCPLAQHWHSKWSLHWQLLSLTSISPLPPILCFIFFFWLFEKYNTCWNVLSCQWSQYWFSLISYFSLSSSLSLSLQLFTFTFDSRTVLTFAFLRIPFFFTLTFTFLSLFLSLFAL